MSVDEVKELYNLDWVQIINDQLENPVSPNIFLSKKYKNGGKLSYFGGKLKKWREIFYLLVGKKLPSQKSFAWQVMN